VPLEKDQWIEYPSTTTKGLESVRTFYDVAIGLDGTIWFATTDGVVKFDGVSWRTYTRADGLPYDDWSNIAIDQEGVVWVGGTKVSRFNGRSWETVAGNLEGVNSISIDKYNLIWFGTNSGPISFDGEKWNDEETKESWFKNNQVWDIGFDSKNDMWCATEKGLAHLHGTSWEIVPVDSFWQGYGTYHGVGDLAIGPDDSVWMLIGQKITQYKNGRWKNYDVTSLIGGYFGANIFVSKKGILWIGGINDEKYQSVLVNFDGKEWKRFDGLPFQTILAINEDSDESLWLATGAAAYRYLNFGG
jgi:ligand-binding sensor domain-containing protein